MADDFADLFDTLLHRRDVSVRAFADRSGLAWSFIHRVRKGLRNPPIDRLAAWADIFKLKGRARQRFLKLGYWSHVPPAIRPWVIKGGFRGINNHCESKAPTPAGTAADTAR